MKLRPYHNPENIDESLVPDGWRFRYSDEMTKPAFNAMLYADGWLMAWLNDGRLPWVTYIVPVKL